MLFSVFLTVPFPVILNVFNSLQIHRIILYARTSAPRCPRCQIRTYHRACKPIIMFFLPQIYFSIDFGKEF